MDWHVEDHGPRLPGISQRGVFERVEVWVRGRLQWSNSTRLLSDSLVTKTAKV
jgi:hypothetical protein